jgi:hypothetical protein
MELFESDVMLHRRTVLSDAQLKTIRTTPFQVIPPPGSGFQIVPHQALISTHFEGGVYTNLADGAHMMITLAATSIAAPTLQYIPRDDGLFLDTLTYLLNTNRTQTRITPISTFQNPDALWDWCLVPIAMSSGENPQMDNIPAVILLVNSAGELTGGDAANTLTVDMFYSIIPVA